ncbi:MAG: response regulator [Kiritimatiellae bacterium]|nr:response regulator [Kiritimatiellia bacterium]
MPTILLVDDDSEFLEATRGVLEGNGMTVEPAATPDEALAKVKTVKPDLVILDVMMPDGYEGFEVARAIREELKLTALPLVILTGIHQRKKVPYRFAPDAHYLPVDVFLDKPTKPDVLVSTVQEILGEKRETPRQPL